MRSDIEDRANDVRVLLETARVPDPRADLARAMAAGVTVRRRRRYLAVATATVVAAVAAASVSQALNTTGNDRTAPPIGDAVTATPAPFASCTVRKLAAPAGVGTLTGRVAADPTGRYAVGGVVTKDGRTMVVRWTDGTPEVLKVPAEAVDAVAVNASGTVVGTAVTPASGEQFAWVLDGGGDFRKLPLVSKTGPVTPYAINARGDVVGDAVRGERTVVVLWPAAEPKRAVVLDAPDNARATGIADDGTVVGALGSGTLPYAWGPDGNGRRLALPEGADTGRVLAVRGQWAAGWVGAAPDETAPPQASDKGFTGIDPLLPLGNDNVRRMAARWNLATGDVDVWPDRSEPAIAVNSSGWVVLPAPDGGAAQVARDGAPVTLPGSEAAYPVSLSDDARVLYGLRALVIEPTPVRGIVVEKLADPLVWSC
ncbi:hypothetical protein [Phytohabitans rumicis]|uniref:hypothetical protein n=1 Tax=Phytohabitans rumicis TaxID=1076125 RepID=UPI0031ED6D2C